MLVDLFKPRSVVDVGCGSGQWCRAFIDAGVSDVLGIDGDYVPRDSLVIPAGNFTPHDLTLPLSVQRRFDLALSLEVGEHLPESSAARFVLDLTALADVVVFSAAIPGQGGTNHVNEQWPDYWASHFADCKYACIDVLRPMIWHDAAIEWWYRQNMLIFASESVLPRLQIPQPARTINRPLSLVHPALFEQTLARIVRKKRPVWKRILRGG